MLFTGSILIYQVLRNIQRNKNTIFINRCGVTTTSLLKKIYDISRRPFVKSLTCYFSNTTADIFLQVFNNRNMTRDRIPINSVWPLAF